MAASRTEAAEIRRTGSASIAASRSSASGSLARMAMSTEVSMTISAAARAHRNRGSRRRSEHSRPIAGAPLADGTEFIAHAGTSGLSALPDQALAQGVDYGFSQGFAGRGGEFARQVVGFGMFDAQGNAVHLMMFRWGRRSFYVACQRSPKAADHKVRWSADRKSTRLNSSHLGISYAV